MSRLRFTHRLMAALAVILFLIIGACTQAPSNPPGCSPGQTPCNGTCVDLTSNPNHCGACGTTCDATAPFCSASACSATCGAGLLACDAACVNVMTSAAHCGNCNNACPSGAACNAGVCGQVPTGSGGDTGVGGNVGTTGGTTGSGAATGNSGGSGAAPGTGGGSGATGGGGNSLLGGYHVHGDWAGFAFTFTDTANTATITPASFEDMLDSDGPYCVSGTVANTEEYTSIAAVGFNTNQPKIEDAETGKVATTGDGLMVDITVNSGSDQLRVQLEDGTDPSDPNAALHRWCANLTVLPDGTFSDTLPWDAFSTECWAPGGETDVPFDPATQLAKVIIYVPDEGPEGAPQPFDFCVNDIGPANVMSRGTGEIVANCGQNVSWSAGSVGDQYGQAQTSDNRYQYQNNGWGWMGGGSHSASLLSSNGFTLTSQTCSRTDDSPCSFPSIYIGTDADGTRTANSGLPKLINQITSAPTCMGWTSGGTPASHEFNVSYDVWFNTNAQATNASKFLMVWYRDPPSFQPGGMTPIATTVIGDQAWAVWHGPNHAQQDITSYVTLSPGGLADGQAYSYNLKDFIDDAVERGYLNASTDNLIAIMGGMEIWGGGQGASINSFSATVN